MPTKTEITCSFCGSPRGSPRGRRKQMVTVGVATICDACVERSLEIMVADRAAQLVGDHGCTCRRKSHSKNCALSLAAEIRKYFEVFELREADQAEKGGMPDDGVEP